MEDSAVTLKATLRADLDRKSKFPNYKCLRGFESYILSSLRCQFCSRAYSLYSGHPIPFGANYIITAASVERSVRARTNVAKQHDNSSSSSQNQSWDLRSVDTHFRRKSITHRGHNCSRED